MMATNDRSPSCGGEVLGVDAAIQGADRYRRALVTMLASVAGRPVNMLLSLATVGIIVRCLGQDRYGIFAVFQNAFTVLGILDFGTQASLVNLLAGVRARKDIPAATSLVSTTFFALAVSGFMTLLAGVIFFGSGIPLRLMGSAASVPASETTLAGFVFLVSLCVALPLSVFDKPSIAQQEGWVNVASQVVGNVILLVGVAAAARLNGGLAWCAVAWLASIVGTYGFCAAVARFRYGDWCVPRVRGFSWTTLTQLTDLGRWFAFTTFVNHLTLSADPLTGAILDRLNGGARAADLSAEIALPARLFGLISAAVMMAVTPLWPAYAEATAAGDRAWMKRTLLLSCAWAAGATSLLAGVAVVFAGPIMRLWVGAGVTVSRPLLIAYAFWIVGMTVWHTIGMFLNGAGHVRYQVVTGIVFLAVVLPAKVIGFQTYGAAGMIGATAIIMFAIQVIPSLAIAMWKVNHPDRGASPRVPATP